ncbi:unnamed protein product [Rodentolepis nana]|uniref:Uncharacterized protein n=1 Tax=Rodentolepis nana TaxID=102285 RepID=A0A0R3TGK0_RODNA|nr:unnamed protein product [Rodentolepis nana]
MEDENEDMDFRDESSKGFMSSEAVALLLIFGYFFIMISIGILVWYRTRRRLKENLKLRQVRKPDCFDQDSQVLKIRYIGIKSLDSLG